MSVKDQIEAAKALASDPRYHERSRAQMVSWAMGRPYHDKVIDECCPDFSCCYPDLFTESSADRWEQYRLRYGAKP